MKHITMLFAVAAAMVLLTASLAAAQAVHPGVCTFAAGVDTCVTTSPGTPIESTQGCEFNPAGRRAGEQTVSQPTIIETTQTYHGMGGPAFDDPVVSPPIPSGEPTLGKCKNVPGPQPR
jgi:hypothetical protein